MPRNPQVLSGGTKSRSGRPRQIQQGQRTLPFDGNHKEPTPIKNSKKGKHEKVNIAVNVVPAMNSNNKGGKGGRKKGNTQVKIKINVQFSVVNFWGGRT